MPANSRGRRSAQTAMFYILEALVRWLAPILSFTAEEIWRHMPGKRGESVFLEQWYELPTAVESDKDMWRDIIAVRDAVNRELEQLRVAGGIGGPLDAEVDLYCSPELKTTLEKLGDELRFVLITSYVRLHDLDARGDEAAETGIDGLFVAVAPSAHGKCIRCWHHREDVGANKEHEQICGRCVVNVTSEQGESREFA
jgi:isoleucyl-tRNA synthetase